MRHLGRALLGLVLGFCLTLGVNATASQIASRNGVVDLSSAQTVTGNKTLSGTTTIGGQKWSVTTTAASATNTQAAATLLSVGFNLITAVSSGYAVKLPLTTAAGDVIFTFNAGDFNLNVYPSTGDRIQPYSANASMVIQYNDFGMWVSTASGVWRKASMLTNFAESYTGTRWAWGDQNGIILQITSAGVINLNNAVVAASSVKMAGAIGLQRNSGVTCATTQTLAAATLLIAGNNQISVCANANDAVKLPAADATYGLHAVLQNDGAQTAQMFPGEAGTKICLTNSVLGVLTGTCGANGASVTVVAASAIVCDQVTSAEWACQ